MNVKPEDATSVVTSIGENRKKSDAAGMLSKDYAVCSNLYGLRLMESILIGLHTGDGEGPTNNERIAMLGRVRSWIDGSWEYVYKNMTE